jgi:hypothetical protein
MSLESNRKHEVAYFAICEHKDRSWNVFVSGDEYSTQCFTDLGASINSNVFDERSLHHKTDEWIYARYEHEGTNRLCESLLRVLYTFTILAFAVSTKSEDIERRSPSR